MPHPVALITGASSGIGLALATHLLSHPSLPILILLDLNPPPSSIPLDTPRAIYIRTDVSSWDSLAAAFATAYAWLPPTNRRLDFCALNAGIDDRDDIFASVSHDVNVPPKKPNMLTFEVNLFGVYYGVKLAAHYMALNPGPPTASSSADEFPLSAATLDDPPLSSIPTTTSSTTSSKGKNGVGAGKGGGGNIVVTASTAGLYSLPSIPQYTSAKHALVGLVRSLGPPAASVANISINAICPAIVATGLAPPGLMSAFDERTITPMSTIIKAFETLGGFADWIPNNSTEKGLGEVKGEPKKYTGQIVECSLGNLYFRDEVEKADDSQKYMAEGALDAWAKAYEARNRKFAAEYAARAVGS